VRRRARPRNGGSVKGIFEGVRVLDFTNVLSGPTLTRLMAEMGADVLKVEMPPAGDMSRGLPMIRNGRSGYFVQQNRGKRSLFIDVKDPRGREVVGELVARVDVVVENFSPGVIDRLGFGWEQVQALNPRAVMCSISAFGQEGPLRDQPGYDAVAQAYGGVLHMNGSPDRPPALMGLSPGDVLTGVHGLAGVAAALYHRERTGRGQRVDVSLLGSYLTCHEINVQAWSVSDGAFQPERSGSVHPLVGGYGIYPVGDGDVMIAASNDRQWAQLCRAMGRPELATDPRYATSQSRTDRRHEVNTLITDWLAGLDGRDAAVAALAAERVPVAPVLSVEEAVTLPHVRQQRLVRRVTDDRIGELDIPGVPVRFSEFPDELDLQAAGLGQHNQEVAAEWLGMEASRYRALVDAGVLLADERS
jgi:crotonobetainyl-CoA:carnitine CoA-transferase CaiB-like acyl-CoA transferase